jgi:pimeloyl-ACP methyl ester carboxylesterase
LATALEQKLSKKGTPLYITKGGTKKSTVVFVHNMWGNHRILSRHVQLFESLGYNCATFNLYRASTIAEAHPFGWRGYLKFMHQCWVEQIEDVLDSIDDSKIIYAMSGPALAALIATSGRKDITHFICDSGPFKEIWTCTYRLFTQIWPVPTALLRALATTGAVFLWGPQAFYRSQTALSHWNPQTPILSIRGGQDPLIFDQNIEGVFKNHSHLNLTIWRLPEAHHLDGLKLDPDLFRTKIVEFLALQSSSN